MHSYLFGHAKYSLRFLFDRAIAAAASAKIVRGGGGMSFPSSPNSTRNNIQLLVHTNSIARNFPETFCWMVMSLMVLARSSLNLSFRVCISSNIVLNSASCVTILTNEEEHNECLFGRKTITESLSKWTLPSSNRILDLQQVQIFLNLFSPRSCYPMLVVLPY